MNNKIVCANYTNLDNEKKVGIFLVIYDEYNDGKTNGGSNVLALKITSHVDVNCLYKLPIESKLLDLDSVVIYSKFYTINKKNIFKVIGTAPHRLINNIESGIYYFMGQVYKQMRLFNE